MVNANSLKKAHTLPLSDRERTILKLMRDLVAALEVAEDNDFSASSRKLLAAAADRATAQTWNLR